MEVKHFSKKVFKYIYYTSIVVLSIWLAHALVGEAMPFEAKSASLISDFGNSKPFIVSISLFVFLAYWIVKSASIPELGWKLIMFFISGFFSFIVFIVLVLSTFCVWIDEVTLFENRLDKSEKIILRRKECGAFDGTDGPYKIVRVKPLGIPFNWVSGIDTSEIVKEDWSRMGK